MRVVSAIESVVAWIGKAAGYLNLLLILVIVVDVTLRALFDQTAAWVGELSWHLFAIIFLLGIPYALQQDRHVRVDLFYERFSPEHQRLVNIRPAHYRLELRRRGVGERRGKPKPQRHYQFFPN